MEAFIAFFPRVDLPDAFAFFFAAGFSVTVACSESSSFIQANGSKPNLLCFFVAIFLNQARYCFKPAMPDLRRSLAAVVLCVGDGTLTYHSVVMQFLRQFLSSWLTLHIY
ncbi:MAG: hypothetical protein PVJ63_06300 [Thioalkalispiraceae bacterium]